MSIKLRKKIEEVNVNELVPYENNPRINDGAVPALVEAIKQLGFNVPLVIDKNNVVICGHTRLKAAQDALYRTRSPFLKRDYAKAIKRKRRLLRAYDGYRKGAAL